MERIREKADCLGRETLGVCGFFLYGLEEEYVMEKKHISEVLGKNTYPGRGIIMGLTADARYAVMAYFIMGRSANSRNRVFVPEKDGLRTKAFDASKVTDPSLIIYAPVRHLGNKWIVTNGDQTDTIYQGLDSQKTFEESLRSRTFEPDAPNYTPRISGVMHTFPGKCNYALSILKSANGNSAGTERFTYAYENPVAGEGRLIHTYKENGHPLPSFEGEPVRVEIGDAIDRFTETLWNSLDADNKVALFVRYVDLETQTYETRIVNRNKEAE